MTDGIVVNWSSVGSGSLLKDLQEAESGFKKTQAAIRALSASSKTLTELTKGFKAIGEVSRLAGELGTTEKQVQAIAVRLQQLNAQGVDTENRFKILNKELGVTERQFEAIDKAVTQYNNTVKRVVTEAAIASKGTQQLSKSLKDVDESGSRAGDALQGIFQGIGQQAAQLAIQLIQQLAQSIKDFVVSSFEANRRLVDFENRLIIATGSAAQAGKELEYVRSVVDRLGLPLEAAIDGFSRLAVSAKGTAFEGEGVRKIFEGVSAASAGLNLSADETAGVFRALDQIISKGKVQAEELRGQLGDRLSGAFQAFAAGLGVTTEELDNLLKQGEVTADQLLPFADELQKRFGSVNLDSPTKALNKLGNAVFDVQSQLGKAINPVFVASVELFTKTLDEAGKNSNAFEIINAAAERFKTTLQENPEIAQKLGEALGRVADIIATQIANGLDTITNLLKENPKIIDEIANNFVKTVELISNLITGVQGLISVYDRVPNSIKLIIQFQQKLVEGIQFAIAKSAELISLLTNIPGIPTDVKKSVTGLGDAFSGLEDQFKRTQSSARATANTTQDAADAFKNQSDAIESGVAQQTAAIKQAEAAGKISAQDAAQQITQIEEAATAQRIALIQERLQAVEAGSDEEKKLTAELYSLQTKQAESAIARQRKLYEDQVKAVEDAANRANDAIAQSATERQLATQRLINDGVLSQEQANQRQLQDTRQTLDAQLQAQQDYVAKLRSLPSSSDPQEREQQEQKIRQAIQETGQIQLQILQNERQQQEAVAEAAIAAIRRQADEQERASERAIAAYQQQLAAVDAASNALSRQNDLLASQTSLQEALNNLRQTSDQVQLDRITRAAEIQQQLSSGEIQSTQVRLQLQRELSALGFQSNTSALTLLRQRQAVEDRLAAAQSAALEAQQAAARASLEIELKRNELAARRSAIEAQIAQTQAQQNINSAQSKLREAQQIVDPQQRANAIAAAQSDLEAAQQTSVLAKQNVATAQEQLNIQEDIATNARAALEAQQAAEIVTARAKEDAREFAQQLALAEASSRRLTANLRGSGDLPAGNRRTGGAMEQGKPYWVGEGAGGRIIPGISELIVPKANSYAIAANKAQEMLRRTAPDRAVVTGAAKTSTADPMLQEMRSLRRDIGKLRPSIQIGSMPTQIHNSMPRDEKKMQRQAERTALEAFRNLNTLLEDGLY